MKNDHSSSLTAALPSSLPPYLPPIFSFSHFYPLLLTFSPSLNPPFHSPSLPPFHSLWSDACAHLLCRIVQTDLKVLRLRNPNVKTTLLSTLSPLWTPPLSAAEETFPLHRMLNTSHFGPFQLRLSCSLHFLPPRPSLSEIQIIFHEGWKWRKKIKSYWFRYELVLISTSLDKSFYTLPLLWDTRRHFIQNTSIIAQIEHTWHLK